ncbi:hypothetical protein [Natrononativus amylolyticus]|uniref:hypothetical protein n=1 Tax=Natrononativus amylolyticus TaxID=2963434 RepID=UPI0020CCAC5B|nr:hypothetical protein [Natrononativus amylolyticus]
MTQRNLEQGWTIFERKCGDGWGDTWGDEPVTLLVLDNNLLSDYLNGTDDARAFLEEHEQERWGVPSIVLFESLMGSLYGHIDASSD